MRGLKGFITGDRWKVLGNQEQADRLAGFLNCCKAFDIEPISPIRLEEGSIIMDKIGFEQELYSTNALGQALSRMGHWKNESNEYVRLPDGCCLNQFNEPKKVIAALEELDSAGYPLTYLPDLDKMPEIIKSRVEVFRADLDSSKLKLSESQPNEGLFNVGMDERVKRVLHVAAPFNYSRVVNGIAVETLAKVHYRGMNISVEDIEMRILGTEVPAFSDKALEALGKIEFISDASRNGGLTTMQSFSCGNRRIRVQGTMDLGYLVVRGNLPPEPIKYSLFSKDNSGREHLLEAERVVDIITAAIPRKR